MWLLLELLLIAMIVRTLIVPHAGNPMLKRQPTWDSEDYDMESIDYYVNSERRKW